MQFLSSVQLIQNCRILLCSVEISVTFLKIATTQTASFPSPTAKKAMVERSSASTDPP